MELSLDDLCPDHVCPRCNADFEVTASLNEKERTDLACACSDLKDAERTLVTVRRRLADPRPRHPQQLAKLRDEVRAIEAAMERMRNSMRILLGEADPPVHAGPDLWDP